MGEPKTEKPILFSAPMVRAILAGQKTQTRRVIADAAGQFWDHRGWSPRQVDADRVEWLSMGGGDEHVHVMRKRCPYGEPGHTLWVRETWGLFDRESFGGERGYAVAWRATDDDSVTWIDGPHDFAGEGILSADERWRPSIHMPRWASRLTLAVLSVRVERLQSITEEDAIAEGMAHRDAGADRYGQPLPGWSWRDPHPVDAEPSFGWEHCLGTARHAFGNLWNEINGKRPDCSWEANPYVWVVGFGPAEDRS